MAHRPIFLPLRTKTSFVREISIEFRWFAGMSVSQKQKSIASLHEAAKERLGIKQILEISSKSPDSIGVSLSAFNLRLQHNKKLITVESLYQGSKKFADGGPFLDILEKSSRDAKTDARLHNSGKLIGFSLLGDDWPLEPLTSYYDWIYLRALEGNSSLSDKLLEFDGFTDIEFNPKKSLNCQARSAALFVSLKRNGMLESALFDRATYFQTIGVGAGETLQRGLF